MRLWAAPDGAALIETGPRYFVMSASIRLGHSTTPALCPGSPKAEIGGAIYEYALVIACILSGRSEDCTLIGLAQTGRGFEERLEHFWQIKCRAADDFEHL